MPSASEAQRACARVEMPEGRWAKCVSPARTLAFLLLLCHFLPVRGVETVGAKGKFHTHDIEVLPSSLFFFFGQTPGINQPGSISLFQGNWKCSFPFSNVFYRYHISRGSIQRWTPSLAWPHTSVATRTTTATPPFSYYRRPARPDVSFRPDLPPRNDSKSKPSPRQFSSGRRRRRHPKTTFTP